MEFVTAERRLTPIAHSRIFVFKLLSSLEEGCKGFELRRDIIEGSFSCHDEVWVSLRLRITPRGVGGLARLKRLKVERGGGGGKRGRNNKIEEA